MENLEIGKEYNVNGKAMTLRWVRYEHSYSELHYHFSDGFFSSGLRESELKRFVK